MTFKSLSLVFSLCICSITWADGQVDLSLIRCAKTTYKLGLAMKVFSVDEQGSINEAETTGDPGSKVLDPTSYSSFTSKGLVFFKNGQSQGINWPERTANYVLSQQLMDALFGTNSPGFYSLSQLRQGVEEFNTENGMTDFYTLSGSQVADLVNSCLDWAFSIKDEDLVKRLLTASLDSSALEPKWQNMHSDCMADFADRKRRAEADSMRWREYNNPDRQPPPYSYGEPIR